jgi:hypothetical protein
MAGFREEGRRFVEAVYGFPPPNEAASGFMDGIVAAIEQTQAIRDRLRFEDEPADFAAALRDLKDEG